MTAYIGSISHGTLRNEDLLESFTEELERLDKESGIHAALIREAQETDPESEYASEVICDLQDALNEFAPHGCYFGNTERDGSDFGFWPDLDLIENGDVLKVSDTSEVPENFNGEIAHVNDHGNLTLYACNDGKLTELWAIV